MERQKNEPMADCVPGDFYHCVGCLYRVYFSEFFADRRGILAAESGGNAGRE